MTGWYGQVMEFRRDGRQWAGAPIVPAGDEKARRDALEADHGAEFGGDSSGECVGYLPHVRLAPGPRGVRSVTVHGPSWDEVLGDMEALVSPADGDGPDTG